MTELAETVTIDGPTAAGKTTLGYWLADHLRIGFLETGYLYRAAAHRVVDGQVLEIAWDDRLLAGVEVRPRSPRPESIPQKLIVEGRELDLAEDLFSPEVDRLVAQVAAVESVRHAVRELSRVAAASERLIASGRDTGVAIVPEADRKLFLTADPAVRASRGARTHPGPSSRQELESKLLGHRIEPAPDASVIDTSAMTIGEVRSAAVRELELDG